MLDPRKGRPALDKKRGQAWWPRPVIPAREAEMGGSSSSTARIPQRPSLQTELGLWGFATGLWENNVFPVSQGRWSPQLSRQSLPRTSES